MAHDTQAILMRPQPPEEKEDEMFDPEDLPGCSDADLEQAGFEADAAQAQADQDAVYGKAQIHTTVEAFAEATGLSVEFIRAHGITSYNSATLVPLHELKEDA